MPNPLLTNPQINVSSATASQASSSKITTSPLAIFIKISLPNNHLKTYRTMLTNLYTNQRNYCTLDSMDAVYSICNLHTLKNIHIINKHITVFWSLWNVVVTWLWICLFSHAVFLTKLFEEILYSYIFCLGNMVSTENNPKVSTWTMTQKNSIKNVVN